MVMGLLVSRLFATPVTWPIALTPLTILDILLMRNGFPALSDWAGQHILITTTAMGLLWLHFNGWRWEPTRRLFHVFPFIDPLGVIGKRVRPKKA